MQLDITGHHVEVTDPLRHYVVSKLEKIDAGLLDSTGAISSENSSSGNLLRAQGRTEEVSTRSKQQESSRHTAWVTAVLFHPSCRASARAASQQCEGYHRNMWRVTAGAVRGRTWS